MGGFPHLIVRVASMVDAGGFTLLSSTIVKETVDFLTGQDFIVSHEEDNCFLELAHDFCERYKVKGKINILIKIYFFFLPNFWQATLSKTLGYLNKLYDGVFALGGTKGVNFIVLTG